MPPMPIREFEGSLPENLADLVTVSMALREDVRAESRRRRRDSLVGGFLILLLIVAVGFGMQVVIQTNDIAKDSKRTAERIESCTTVGGECYRENQRSTGGAISRIIKAVMYVEECSKVTTTDSALEQCVNRKLAASPN